MMIYVKHLLQVTKKNKLLSPGTKEAATTIPMDAIQRKNTAAYLKSQRLFTIPMQNTPEE